MLRFTFLILVLMVVKKSVSQDPLELTEEQKKQFELFKEATIDEAVKTFDPFVGEDIHTIRFLRAKNFNLQNAVDMYLKQLKWRTEQDIKNIHEKFWTDMVEAFHVDIDGFDKQGRPLYYIAPGHDWNITKATKEGKLDILMRWAVVRAADYLSRTALEAGQTQFTAVIDLAGFSVEKHLCGLELCLGFYKDCINLYENNFPEWAYKIFVINNGPIFETVMKAIQPLFSSHTSQVFHLLGTDRKNWDPLFADVDASELNLDQEKKPKAKERKKQLSKTRKNMGILRGKGLFGHKASKD